MRLVSYIENLAFLTLSATFSLICILLNKTVAPIARTNTPTEAKAHTPVNLSALNKKIVAENRKINNILLLTRRLPKSSVILLKDKSKELAEHCSELERLVNEAQILRDELELEKDENHNKSNINRTKLNYIKESIIEGKYSFDKDTSLFTFDNYSKKDYHNTFHLDITLNKFNEIILSEYNQNIRINFYQL